MRRLRSHPTPEPPRVRLHHCSLWAMPNGLLMPSASANGCGGGSVQDHRVYFTGLPGAAQHFGYQRATWRAHLGAVVEQTRIHHGKPDLRKRA